MIRLTASVLALAMLTGIGPAAADTRTASIQPDKPARIHVLTALKKDCSQGEAGGIRITGQPKNGTASVRTGKLKTPAGFRCPNVDTPAQQLVYEPKKGFQGTDEVTFETKDADGTNSTHTVKINVGGKPAPKGSGGVVDL